MALLDLLDLLDLLVLLDLVCLLNLVGSFRPHGSFGLLRLRWHGRLCGPFGLHWPVCHTRVRRNPLFLRLWQFLINADMHIIKSNNLQYNRLGRWVAGTNNSSTKRLMFQVLFFFIISCKILCKNSFNLFSYFSIILQK